MKAALGPCALIVGVVLGVLPWTAQASTKVGKTGVQRVAYAPAKVANPVAEPLTDAHLAVAQRVYQGQFPCELAGKVSVQADAQQAGRFVVTSAGQRFVMVPVITTTGAVRLEDARAGAVWLQLANKSMLMNQRQGKRLADACMSPEQVAMARALEESPVPGLLDATPAPAAAPAEKDAAGIATN
jgi:hypothetical protein